MDNYELSSVGLMLHGISLVCRSRKTQSYSLQQAMNELLEGIDLMNISIKKAPDNIENRKMRLRQFLGITFESPVELHVEIVNDIKYFETIFEGLELDDKSFVLNACGDYYILLGESEKGLRYFKRSINLASDSLSYDYAKITYEKENKK